MQAARHNFGARRRVPPRRAAHSQPAPLRTPPTYDLPQLVLPMMMSLKTYSTALILPRARSLARVSTHGRSAAGAGGRRRPARRRRHRKSTGGVRARCRSRIAAQRVRKQPQGSRATGLADGSVADASLFVARSTLVLRGTVGLRTRASHHAGHVGRWLPSGGKARQSQKQRYDTGIPTCQTPAEVGTRAAQQRNDYATEASRERGDPRVLRLGQQVTVPLTPARHCSSLGSVTLRG